MRIALVSTPFVAVPPKGYGGTELVVHELLRGLLARGHDVTLFATGDSDAPDLRFLVPEPVWPPDPRVEFRHSAAVARVLARESYDVVHAHTPGLLRFQPDLPVPMVYTVHHARDERHSRLYLQRPGVQYVAISARQAELEPDLDCQVVHHGLDPERFPRGDGAGGHALFLGRMSECKAPDIAVEAARLAGVPVTLAGEVHPEEDTTREWASRVEGILALRHVRHLGTVRGKAKIELLSRARALLMPLRWEEPFGLVMIEAMLCGTPVLAFPRGAAPEIVDEGLTGFLVDDAPEMALALRRLDGFDRDACRDRARARFSAERMVRDYERVYAAAVASGFVSESTEESSYAG